MKENSIEEDIKVIESIIEEYEDCCVPEIDMQVNVTFREKQNNALNHILSDYKRVLKENKELNNRCKNLDEEAQAYVEELMGDSTLKDRIINRLNKENEEIKIKNNAIKRESEAYAEHMIRLDNELNLEKEKSKYEWIRQNCLSQELVNKLYIPKSKLKDIIDRIDYDIKKTKEIISKNTNIYASYRKNDYQIVRLRAMNTKSLDIKKRLQELLESEE